MSALKDRLSFTLLCSFDRRSSFLTEIRLCLISSEQNVWTLNESRRNGEVVFNLNEDIAIKAANKKLAEELAEEKRINEIKLAEEKESMK